MPDIQYVYVERHWYTETIMVAVKASGGRNRKPRIKWRKKYRRRCVEGCYEKL